MPPESSLIQLLMTAKAMPVENDSAAELLARLLILYGAVGGGMRGPGTEPVKKLVVSVPPDAFATAPGPYPNLVRSWVETQFGRWLVNVKYVDR